MKTLNKVFLFIYIFNFLEIDASLNFSNDSSKFMLQNDISKIRIKTTGTYDIDDLGITDNLNRIDLINSNNNHIILDNNFQLEDGFLFSTSGTINGNGYSLIMNGNLTIPALTTLKITSSLSIEGNGHTLFIDNFGQILTDTHSTLTLRNMIIQNANNNSGKPPIAAGGADTKIALDNVKIYFGDDFWFNQGSLFFHNNVLYSGGSKFLYCSTQPSYVAPSSTLLFDKDTTFFYCPKNTNDCLIIQQDPSSTIYFDGSTLQSTPTGLNLSDGHMFFENQVKFDVGTEFNTSMFNINQIDSEIDLQNMNWDFSGQFLAVSGQSINPNNNQVKIFQLDSTNLSELETLQYGSMSSIVYSAAWSPDGKYLAVGGCGAGPVEEIDNNDNLRIYYFDPATFVLVPQISVDLGITATVNSIDWGGLDDYYLAVGSTGALAVGGFSNNDNLRIYHFDVFQDTLSTVTSFHFGPSVNTAKWDFSGSYLAVGGVQSAGSCNLNLFTLDPVTNSLTLLDAKSFGIAANTSINSLSWTSESRFLAVGGGSTTNYATATQNIVIYEFNPANITPLTFLTFASPVEDASVNHIVVKNLKWSPDNNLLLYSGINPASGNWSSDVYYFDSTFDINISQLKNISRSSSFQQYAADWNPSTNLLTSNLSNFIDIYSIVGVSPKLISNQNYTTNYLTDAGIYSMDWHPDGDYIVIGGQGATAVGEFDNTDELRIYRFSSLAESLYTVTSQKYGQRVCSTSWSPDGNYLSVGGISPIYGAGGFNNTDQLRIYNFAQSTVSPIISVAAGSSAEIYSIAWHPSGNYIAIGCYSTASVGGFAVGDILRIYSFNGTSLIPVTGYNFDDTLLTVAGIDWSPNGQYIAIGTCHGRPTSNPTTGTGLTVFEFLNNNSLVQRAAWNDSSAVLSVNWEFDNRYITVAYGNPAILSKIYFNGSFLQEINSWGDVTFFNTDVKMSPDGQKIAYTAKNGDSNDFGYISINDFAQKNSPFYYQKITGVFNILSNAWRNDSKYLATGSYNMDSNAQQISVFKVDNLANINRTGSTGLDIGKLVDANVLGNGSIVINGTVSYATD
ncbi:MAG: hypothetical protein US49_C0001G0252 [candidate division TM6 bacterium GW2011_GWF2_37_49]|nr:MAG: hypothetical protein US49_C0001G0252 [candidate division TM6 bacterium GW2011_GWF2_37_49]